MKNNHYYGRFGSPNTSEQGVVQTGNSSMFGFYALVFTVIAMFAFTATFANEINPKFNKTNDEPASINLKGDIVNTGKVDIYVFEYNDSTCTWERIAFLENEKRYNLSLDASKEYQVWFMSDSLNKIMYVRSSDAENPYYYYLDVDFSNPNCCVVYKDPNAKRYFIEPMSYADASKSCFQ